MSIGILCLRHKHMCKQVKHLRRHKQAQALEKRTCSFYLCYVVALTSENWVNLSTSTRHWTNHRSLWPRPHANISNAIWRKARLPSCLSSGWGDGWPKSRTGSNMPFCAGVCPYAYAYALVKTRLYNITTPWLRTGSPPSNENKFAIAKQSTSKPRLLLSRFID